MSQDGEVALVALFALALGLLVGWLVGSGLTESQIVEDIDRNGIYESGDRRIVGRVEEKEWPE